MDIDHMIDLDAYPVNVLYDIVGFADRIYKNPEEYAEAAKGKIMATLFYEPSTRTQMSFQTAMLRLGGSFIGFDDPQNSSVSKGESLKDTIRVVSGYTDVIVMRNPMEGAAQAASLYSKVPVINAGDGGHLHPTQTLTDVVTLFNKKGRLDHLTIGVCGDLMHGRTVHSLIKTMSRFEKNSFVLISTPELGVPQYIKDIMDSGGCSYREVNTLEEAMPELDILYMTRIQRERFPTDQAYLAQQGVYVLDKKKLRRAKADLCILHPLPRVDEITVEVDDDPRACYFEQAECGVFARMALILGMLEAPKRKPYPARPSTHPADCANPRCITRTEPYIPKSFFESGDMLVCAYCENRQLI